MSADQPFYKDQGGNIFVARSATKSKSMIIKKNQVTVGRPKKVTDARNGGPHSEMHEKATKIEPLFDGDVVVGLVVKCACGEEVTVSFEFADEPLPESPAGEPATAAAIE